MDVVNIATSASPSAIRRAASRRGATSSGKIPLIDCEPASPRRRALAEHPADSVIRFAVLLNRDALLGPAFDGGQQFMPGIRLRNVHGDGNLHFAQSSGGLGTAGHDRDGTQRFGEIARPDSAMPALCAAPWCRRR